ncbi:hypothetical protein EXU48_15065 [Occultella glacieicola]|uniref:PNPLA domain-containing protein n=1 Tax=Occultella glacieicola TaxID=2518684 RepID=A0ABY2E0X2_9MICO|nr:patatin-like phospholipase family protein [Occultella glacieicola]TDE91477.1 hypothetical protein EXU48_15065 [Occultella glacieicola]
MATPADLLRSVRHGLIRILGGVPAPAAPGGPTPAGAHGIGLTRSGDGAGVGVGGDAGTGDGAGTGEPQDAAAEPVVGLVLGGGGARSSFEIGALSYLYERERITPSVITGTSAGSILAGVLAQHGDLAGQQRTVAELRRIWLGMTASSDMFTELPWFTALREDMPAWRKLAAIHERSANRASLTENLAAVLAGPRRAVDRLAERARAVAVDERAAANRPTDEAAAGPDRAVGPGATGPSATGPSATGPSATGPSPSGPNHTEPSHAEPSATGPSATGPSATGPSATGPSATGPSTTAAVTGAAVRATASTTGRRGTGERVPPERDLATLGSGPLELIAALWEVGRTGPDVNAVVRGAAREQSAFVVGPIIEELLDPAVFDPSLPATSGIELRLATVHLESGELRYVDAAGRLRDANDRLLDAEPVTLDRAILASCAIPAGLPPVRLNDGTYVDGGTRENVPVAIAYEHLGVDRCYVVTANPVGLPPAEDFAGKALLEIVMRAASEIMPDEIQADEVERARALGATVIDPELDIHDIVTIEPGLIAIAMDYGYLRAADVCANASEAEHEHTRDLINLRRLIWTVEDDLFASAPGAATMPRAASTPGPATGGGGATVGPDAVLDPGGHDLAGMKLRLRDLVAGVPPERLPPGARDWWRGWERHANPVTAAPHWLDNDPASSSTLES